MPSWLGGGAEVGRRLPWRFADDAVARAVQHRHPVGDELGGGLARRVVLDRRP